MKIKILRFVLLAGIVLATACTTTTATPPPGTATLPAPTETATLPALTATPNGGLPDMPTKPTPLDVPFNGCPPQGSGGDQEQNLLKNRSDEGNYAPVNFDSIYKLTWPPAVQQKDRNT